MSLADYANIPCSPGCYCIDCKNYSQRVEICKSLLDHLRAGDMEQAHDECVKASATGLSITTIIDFEEGLAGLPVSEAWSWPEILTAEKEFVAAMESGDREAAQSAAYRLICRGVNGERFAERTGLSSSLLMDAYHAGLEK